MVSILERKKISFIDSLCYYFDYPFINSTKSEVISKYNFDNDLDVCSSSYSIKEALIPIEYYENIYKKVYDLFNELNKNNINNINNINKKTIYACFNLKGLRYI